MTRSYNTRMAEPAPLPSEERVRELTADPKLTPEQANEYGDLFARAGKLAQALMFYERTKDPARLEQVKKEAVRAGDAFLLHGVSRLPPHLVDQLQWGEGGGRGTGRGKISLRARVLRAVGRHGQSGIGARRVAQHFSVRRQASYFGNMNPRLALSNDASSVLKSSAGTDRVTTWVAFGVATSNCSADQRRPPVV